MPAFLQHKLSMITKNRNEPILLWAQRLFFIFLLGVLVVVISSLSSIFMAGYFDALADNQYAEDALSRELRNNLLAIEIGVNQLLILEDPRDLALVAKSLEEHLKEIHDILQVLRNGGVFTKSISANLEEQDEVRVALRYERHDQSKYAVEVLELTPRILDLEGMLEKLVAATEKKLSATDPDERLALAQEASLIFKQTESFLQRSKESANDIHYQTNLRKNEIAAQKQKIHRLLGGAALIVILLTIIVAGVLSGRTINRIRLVLQEREKSQNVLQETELRYRTVADFTYGWEYWVNPDGSYHYVSPSSERVTGYSAEHIYQTPNFISSIVLPEDETRWLSHQRGEETQVGVREIRFRIRHKDGRTLWLEHTCQPVRAVDGTFLGFRGSNRDVTREVHARNALEESEKRYRALVENSPIGIFLATKEGEIISINAAMLTMLGSPSKEETRKINLLTFPPLVKSGFTNDFQQVIQTNKTKVGEVLYTSKWGKTLYSRYALTAVRDANDNLIGVQALLEDITEQATYKKRLEREVRNLAAINKINNTIISRPDLETMVKSLLLDIRQNLAVDAADLLVYDEKALNLSCIAQEGFTSPADAKKTTLRIGSSYAGKAALKRKIIHLENLQDAESNLTVPLRWHQESFRTYYGIPLLVKGELKGILELFHRSEANRDQDWLRFLETLAQQAAIAIDSHFLLDALHRSNTELELAYETTLEGWARALELRDYETKGHTERVTKLTESLARKLGVRGDEMVHIRRGALLHDIGKIAVPDHILLKQGPCTPEEWKLIREHPYFGYEMLKEITYLKPSLDIVLYHHEKWNGDGYPYGLSGEKIPFAARIFALVDVWDALINDRPYHAAWEREQIITYIKVESGKHFDPKIAEVFIEMIENGEI